MCNRGLCVKVATGLARATKNWHRVTVVFAIAENGVAARKSESRETSTTTRIREIVSRAIVATLIAQLAPPEPEHGEVEAQSQSPDDHRNHHSSIAFGMAQTQLRGSAISGRAMRSIFT